MAADKDDYFQKVGRSTATTLSAPGYTIGNTTINVASTANWGDSTGVTFAIDEVDSDGVRIAETYNVFRGVVSSATQVSDLEYVGGDANRDYSAGATTRVYVTVSSYRDNRLIDGILVHADQDGTLKAGAVDNAAVLASDVVTTAKIDDGAVTFGKLDTSALSAKYTTANAWSESTTYNAVSSLSLEAGVWLIIATLNFECATTSVRTGYMKIRNTTDSTDISGEVRTRIENSAGDNAAVVTTTQVATLAGTKTVAMQAKVTDVAGTNTVIVPSLTALKITSVN